MNTFVGLDKVSTVNSWEDTFREIMSIGVVFAIDEHFNRLEVRNSGGELLCVLWEEGIGKLITALS